MRQIILGFLLFARLISTHSSTSPPSADEAGIATISSDLSSIAIKENGDKVYTLGKKLGSGSHGAVYEGHKKGRSNKVNV